MEPKHIKYSPLPNKIKCQIQTLHQVYGKKISEIRNDPELKLKRILKNVPKSTIYKIAKTPIDKSTKDKRLKNKNSGRKGKLSRRDKSKIKIKLKKLHKSKVNFTSISLQRECDLEQSCSNLTFRRALKSMGFEYLVKRRKGLMGEKDMKNRVKYAKEIIKEHGKGAEQLEFWRHGISLYTDIVGFEWKVNMNILFFSLC